MPDGPNAVFQALGRAAGATGRNQTGQGTPGPAGDVAAGLGAAAGQASANENEAIPLSMTPQELAAWAGTPPRLVRALNTTVVVDAKTLPLYAEFKQLKGDVDLDFAAPGALEVRYLIRHIYDRLITPFVDIQGRAVGGSPWLGPDGGATLGEQPSTDEHWARRAAEALSLLPYMLPTTVYAGFHSPKLTDEHLLYKLQGDSPTGDHAYPLALECQQSVTFAALSRGYDIALKLDDSQQNPTDGDGIRRPRLKTLFSAGPSGNVVNAMSPAAEVSWLSRDKGTTTLTKLDAGFGPGSAFTFNRSVLDPPGTPYKQTAAQNPHTAFAIRTRRDDKGVLRAVQFFDVGGMNVPETPHPAIEKGIAAESVYAYEYPWSTSGQAGAKGPYAGHAQLAPSNDTAWRGIFRLQDARPLGLARLVLVRRRTAEGVAVDLKKDPPSVWLLYASPMMLMYEDNPDPFAQPSNYALTRYAWSLRDMPGREHIQAIWQITAPRSVFADAMAYGRGTAANRVATTRATTLAEMIADVAARKPAWNIKVDGSKALTLNQEIYGLVDLSAKPDGQVIVYDVVRSDYKTSAVTGLARDAGNNLMAGDYALGHFPWGKPTAGEGIDLATFTDLPAAFAPVAPPPPPPDPDDPYGD